ncbi:Transposase [Wolbachia endosymbiont of Cylisticus convexus]|nr:Transposase for transposon Tn5 [Wolbachia endosymbiont of Cylisticus convexus]RDD34475.1 Transposase for transposon Tn5 [Wolbachia endosymbiont of Cylisticus convexus]RDD34604.1 Transposase for transposon Tn5 [Wolbachia endosymbiont of Cylisticus convexus]RDD35443.1 Transposase [Wolbachia endosymbiont of Cylisticus convexus]
MLLFLNLTPMEAITVCDREADMYDLFEVAHSLNSAVLVRACQNRIENIDVLEKTNKSCGKLLIVQV